jgi:uncharacterized membrane protein YeaQ/YmgE (transglycosylase-associated protein family)
MNINKFADLITSMGKGILMGICIGCALLGLFLLSFSYSNGQGLNIGAFVAIISGSACILLSLNSSKKQL